MEILIILALRLLGPLLIFRWPLFGGVLALFLDAIDIILAELLAFLPGDPLTFGMSYHTAEKLLDIYYLSFEWIVSLRWADRRAKKISTALFWYRFIGTMLFEVTGIRKLLFFFPNIFESFYLAYLALVRFLPKYVPKSRKLFLFLLCILAAPKLWQEWLLHYDQIGPWSRLKDLFLR